MRDRVDEPVEIVARPAPGKPSGERLDRQAQPLGHPAHDHQVVRGDVGRTDPSQVGGQLLAQVRDPAGVAVVQRVGGQGGERPSSSRPATARGERPSDPGRWNGARSTARVRTSRDRARKTARRASPDHRGATHGRAVRIAATRPDTTSQGTSRDDRARPTARRHGITVGDPRRRRSRRGERPRRSAAAVTVARTAIGWHGVAVARPARCEAVAGILRKPARRRGHAGARADPRDQETLGDKLLVGLHDHPARQPEVPGQLAAGGQPDPGRQAAPPYGLAKLAGDLAGDTARRAVDGEMQVGQLVLCFAAPLDPTREPLPS